MAKFVTNRGVVIETTEERAAKYPTGLEPQESKKAPAKKAAPKKSDEK